MTVTKTCVAQYDKGELQKHEKTPSANQQAENVRTPIFLNFRSCCETSWVTLSQSWHRTTDMAVCRPKLTAIGNKPKNLGHQKWKLGHRNGWGPTSTTGGNCWNSRWLNSTQHPWWRRGQEGMLGYSCCDLMWCIDCSNMIQHDLGPLSLLDLFKSVTRPL